MSSLPNDLNKYIISAAQVAVINILGMNNAILREHMEEHYVPKSSEVLMNNDNEINNSVDRREFSQYEKRMDEKFDHIGGRIEDKMDILIANINTGFANQRADFATHKKWVIGGALIAVSTIFGLFIRYYLAYFP